MWDLPRLGTEPILLHWQADSYPLYHQGSPCQCSVAVMEERIFGGPYSAFLELFMFSEDILKFSSLCIYSSQGMFFVLPVWFRTHLLCWGIFKISRFLVFKSEGLKNLLEAFSISSFNLDLCCRIIWWIFETDKTLLPSPTNLQRWRKQKTRLSHRQNPRLILLHEWTERNIQGANNFSLL